MDRRKGGQEGQTDPILYYPSGQGRGSNSLSSASDWWEYTKSCLKENAGIFSKFPPLKKYYNFKTKIRQKRKLIQRRKLQTRN